MFSAINADLNKYYPKILGLFILSITVVAQYRSTLNDFIPKISINTKLDIFFNSIICTTLILCSTDFVVFRHLKNEKGLNYRFIRQLIYAITAALWLICVLIIFIRHYKYPNVSYIQKKHHKKKEAFYMDKKYRSIMGDEILK